MRTMDIGLDADCSNVSRVSVQLKAIQDKASHEPAVPAKKLREELFTKISKLNTKMTKLLSLLI